jgi:hypothetical protein
MSFAPAHRRALPRPHTLALAAAAGCLAVASGASAQSFVDDFNDGDDVGWTPSEPLAPFGAGLTRSFPNGGYRLQSPASPTPAQLGVARAGVYRTGVNTGPSYTASVDIVNFGAERNLVSIGFGLTDFGLGKTDGYLLGLDLWNNVPGAQLVFDRVDDESGTFIGSGAFIAPTLTNQKDYRLVLEVNGGNFTGRLYDLADLSTPLGVATATDLTYGPGAIGMVLSGIQLPVTVNPNLDVTFDNFTLTVPEPASLSAIAAVGTAMLRRRRAS